ncbi:hypothetical protein [Ralstonia pickettii]|uniref:hypothetical protein n=1 Tax=Ralstonia pickettii TaxID=329 RepID=UPI0015BBEE94|nr:hypothetical protein [Ralstonia pickettii]NWK44785.1 hypothetical protein [Ralstonia pickettii]
MSEEISPQERIAAARRLYAVLKEYVGRAVWTPVEGALILSGICPPKGCTEIPSEGKTFDGAASRAGSHAYFTAQGIMYKWEQQRDDKREDGDVMPTELAPHEFFCWCQEEGIQTAWMPLIRDAIWGTAPADGVDFIPAAIVAYATQAGKALQTIQNAVGEFSADASPGGAELPKKRKSVRRLPMPIPANRDHLSTEEFAAVLGVEPQSVRKRHSMDGHYQGIRPTKLPNRQLLWPADEVKRVLSGERLATSKPAEE